MNHGESDWEREQFGAARKSRAQDRADLGEVVYFVQHDIGDRRSPIKIGRARDISRRLVMLQVGNPYELFLLGTMPGGVALERQLHRRFKAERHFFGEWFGPSDELLAFIRENARCDRSFGGS